jgi:hypothetical protein
MRCILVGCVIGVMCVGTARADIEFRAGGCLDTETNFMETCTDEFVMGIVKKYEDNFSVRVSTVVLFRNPFNGKMEPKREFFADRHSIIDGVVVEWSGIEHGMGTDGKIYWRKRP